MAEMERDGAVLESVAWLSFGRGDPPGLLARPLAKQGLLRLADGRLSFTTKNGVVTFDRPLAELHSCAPCELGAGIDVWEGLK